MRILIAITALVLAFPAPAGETDARAQLDRFSEGLERLSARFHQATLDADGGVIEESSGRMAYMAPDRFRWDYDEPFPQVMVADGERLWHYDESLEQVTVREQPPAAESPMMVLTQPELLDRFYEIQPGDEAHVLEFVPIDEESDFERARLTFNAGAPETLNLDDRFGQTTRLTLSEIRRNPDLDQDTFEFEPPEGVDMLEGY